MQFSRQNNDKGFNKLKDLVINLFEYYEEKSTGIKLKYRIWKAISMYDAGSSYENVYKHFLVPNIQQK